MSIGLYKHPHFGLMRRYILSNRYVLQTQLAFQNVQSWLVRYQQFQNAYLRGRKIEYVLFPQEVFSQKQDQQFVDEQSPRRSQIKLNKISFVYEHYVLTLGSELRQRINNKEPFSLQELWYILYALVIGVQELIDIHSVAAPDKQLIINPETILLNELGQIKLLSSLSAPLELPVLPAFQTSTVQNQSLYRKYLLSASFSVGRVMACLLLTREMSFYEKDGNFDMLKFIKEFSAVRTKFGVLGNLVLGMLQGIPDQRVLLHEISALLTPYEECLLNLEAFRLDRNLCRESMLQTFAKPS